MELRLDVLGRVPVALDEGDKEVEVEQEGSSFFWFNLFQNSSCHCATPRRGWGSGEGAISLTGLWAWTILLKYSSSLSQGRRPDIFTFEEGENLSVGIDKDDEYERGEIWFDEDLKNVKNEVFNILSMNWSSW